MKTSKAWSTYRRLFIEMEEKRLSGILTQDEGLRYMQTLNLIYPKLTLREFGEAADLAVYFYKKTV